ncbi:MAG: polyprenyl synthetase family protein [Patescibacteria group bacterium]|jgi:geranylgeranyl diphosphate synthase type I
MISTTNFKNNLLLFRRDMERRMHLVIEQEKRLARQVDPTAVDLVQRLEEFALRLGSKRLRGYLVKIGYEAISGRMAPASVANVAAAAELMHSYMLIHDDIIDQDNERRGGLTVHVQLANLYHNWHHGESLAILCGNITGSLADECIATADISAEKKIEIWRAFQAINRRTNYGEALDVVMSLRRSADLKKVLRVHLNKTAYYSVEGPLRIGALLAGAKPSQLKSIRDFALPLGVGYQLQDDLAGVFGQPKQTGKPDDSDIKEGKLTLLYCHASKFLPQNEKRWFMKHYGQPKLNRTDVIRIRSLFIEYGALADSLRRINLYLKRSLKILDHDRMLSLRGHRLLREFVAVVTERNHLNLDKKR